VPLALNTRVTELGDSRVRVDVEVPPDELEGHLQRKARELGRELKLPGFRRGKVPPALVIKRIGREAVLDEAVRDTLASWYSDAIERAGIVPVGDPKLELGKLPPAGKALEFSIEIGVLPTATLGDYLGLEVPRREPEVQDEQIDAAVEALRERLARLKTAERPAARGDFVVIDYAGTLDDGDDGASSTAGEEGERKPFPGGEARDQLIELGGGNLLPGFEEALLGASAGDVRTVEVTFPPDYPSERLAGRGASFEVTVKEVKLKELPPLDDDLAVDSGFDDLAELRADISEHLLADDRAAVEAEFRQAALDAAVAAARVDVTPELVHARAQEMWERMLRSLAQRGITREGYLRLSGNREKEVVGELEPEAELALRREAVITAVVAAEGIRPSQEDVLAALAPAAEREEVEATELLEQLRSAGRVEELQEDLAARQAIDLIAERAKPIPPAQARAREQLWTPEKAADEAERRPAPEPAPARLWTPDR
jgi:trigger factor